LGPKRPGNPDLADETNAEKAVSEPLRRGARKENTGQHKVCSKHVSL